MPRPLDGSLPPVGNRPQDDSEPVLGVGELLTTCPSPTRRRLMSLEPTHPAQASVFQLWTRRILTWALPALVGLALLSIVIRWHTAHLAAADPSDEPSKNQAKQEPAAKKDDDNQGPGRRIKAPELEGGKGWLNTAGPIRLKDLKGKIVVLDFWTYCCINCIHTLPDLAKLEKKYANELVVIGVHSAKFENERQSDNIRKAILRYEISHPVVNDAEMKIWQNYRVDSWPSLYLIDPEGYLLGKGSGEGLYEALDEHI